MRAAEQHYANLENRRDDYVPKRDAYAALKMAILAFSNWLLNVEAVGKEAQDEMPDRQPVATTTAMGHGERRGTKRERSSSSHSGDNPTTILTEDNSSTVAPTTHKRLKFSDTVEFREDYRPFNLFMRGDEAYVPGRYALPEGSEYEDTSGSGKGAVKFLGMKKVGNAWVEVDFKDDESNIKKTRRKNREARDARQDEAQGAIVAQEEKPSEDALTDERAQRLARRTKRPPPITPRRLAKRSEDDRPGGSMMELSFRNEDKTRLPTGTSAVASDDGESVDEKVGSTTVGLQERRISISGHRGFDTLQTVDTRLAPCDSEELRNLRIDQVDSDAKEGEAHSLPKENEIEMDEDRSTGKPHGAANQAIDYVNLNVVREGVASNLAADTALQRTSTVGHGYGIRAVDDQNRAVSKDTVERFYQDKEDATRVIVRDNDNPLAVGASASGVDRLNSTIHDLEKASWRTLSIHDTELQDRTSATTSPAQPHTSTPVLRNSTPEDALTANTVLGLSPAANHARHHTVADPDVPSPATSATSTMLDPGMDASG